ncbi:MAG: hypothetical protein EHM47_06755 [Ignavibacteriales bacterium]|nr:MAG: hypothetical protein EHM47_06755 [Ignavibacteriales bacterium]
MKKNSILKTLLLILPVIMALMFFILYIKTASELSDLKTKYQKTVEDNGKYKAELTARNDNLNKLLHNGKDESLNNISLTSWDIERLKKKGLSNPVRDIITDLTEHTKLIPYEGVLGGTMRFYDREIRILNSKWVFAYFEDGHIAGEMLLEYNVDNDGTINWKRIAETKN